MDPIRRVSQKLRPYDRLTLGYLIIVLFFLAISPHPPSAALRITVTHGVAIIGVLLLANFADRSPFLRRLHDFYPMLLFIALFHEFTHISTVLFHYWLEPALIKFDLWIFGGSPQQWTIAHLSPAAIEFFALAYGSYYLIIPGTLFLAYQKDYPLKLTAATSQICLTMFVCYVLFMLFPAQGPHHALAGQNPVLIEGGFFTHLVHEIQKTGSVHGAAFPSSHVAAAWAAFFILRRLYRKASWPVGVLIGTLTLSVFIIGYHFSLDALGGMAVAFGINAAMKKRLNSQADLRPEH